MHQRRYHKIKPAVTEALKYGESDNHEGTSASGSSVAIAARARGLSGLDFAAATDLLLAFNVATALQNLSPLKSVGLHKLKGDRAGQWAMTVKARWRICFSFRKGDAYDVEIVDHHRG